MKTILTFSQIPPTENSQYSRQMLGTTAEIEIYNIFGKE
jgi:hypothetical protein